MVGNITHLTVDGGWTVGGTYGLYLEHVATGTIQSITCEGGSKTPDSAGIYIGTACNAVYVIGLGEIDGYTHRITVDGASHIYAIGDNTNGSNQDVNTINGGTCHRFGDNLIRVNGNDKYYAEIHSDYQYTKSFRLNVQGGGGNGGDLLWWADTLGLNITSGAPNTYLPITFAEPITLTPYGATHVSSNNTIFVDSTDNIFKFKDNSGNINKISTFAQSATAVSLASNGVITSSGISLSRVSPTSAVTGIILQAGTIGGQKITVVNESSNTVTFASSGSNVADGASDIINGTSAREFVWDAGTSLWYRLQ